MADPPSLRINREIPPRKAIPLPMTFRDAATCALILGLTAMATAICLNLVAFLQRTISLPPAGRVPWFRGVCAEFARGKRERAAQKVSVHAPLPERADHRTNPRFLLRSGI